MVANDLKRFSRQCYYVCLGLLIVLGILCFVCNRYHIHLAGNLSGRCILHEITGYYCPGCGGTRAFDALAHGRVLLSLFYHPVVVYTVAIMLIYVLSHTVSILSKERIKALLFRPLYLYLMIAVILVQWAIKNAIYFFGGIQVIG